MKAVRRDDLPLEDPDADRRESDDLPADENFWAGSGAQPAQTGDGRDCSPEHRAVVNFTYFHEMDYREIAQIMECPVDTVKTRMFHARRHLRKHLGGELNDWI